MATYELIRTEPVESPTRIPASLTVRSHLAWAVVSTLLCFAPTGVAAVVYAARVQPLLAAGDVEGAQRASRIAKQLCVVSLALTVLFVAVIAFGIDGYACRPGRALTLSSRPTRRHQRAVLVRVRRRGGA